MHHVIDTAHGLTQTVGVARITDEVTHVRRVERLCISYCLSSSRENINTRLGWYCPSTRRMKIDLPLNMPGALPRVSLAYASNCAQFTPQALPRVKPLRVKARFWL